MEASMSVLSGHHNRGVIQITVQLLFIVLTLCSSFQVVAEEAVYNPTTGDYRPVYTNFSYSIFKELPSFPFDFWIKKALFDNQGLEAKRLAPECYLQPEIMPGWAQWHDRVYGEKNRSMVGLYGISIYPSRFDIFNMKKMETTNISTLLYTAFGVEIYQGAKLVAVYDNTSVDIKLMSPNSNVFLLTPTYPSFNASWCRPIIYKITMLKQKNTTIEIMEIKPPSDIDSQYANEYGNKYVSGGSMLGLRVPKMKIYIYAAPWGNISAKDKNVDNYNPYLYLFVIMTIVVVVAVFVYARLRKKR
jgi:hypothetical protein